MKNRAYGFVLLYTLFIFIFSIVMVGVSSYRGDIAYNNYSSVQSIYNGPLVQYAPLFDEIAVDSAINREYSYSPAALKRFSENANITSTTGKVTVIADFVKKGLIYQPSYKTIFNADFTLKNSLNEESLVSFFLPFPSGSYNAEISDAKLLVDGKEYTLSKGVDSVGKPGLNWEGKIPAQSEKIISVSYNTVALSKFSYEGFENPKGSQDFKFDLTIQGTRAYNISQGLSVDSREFKDNEVTLSWNKKDLYSAPKLSVEVGSKINPAEQVSKVYLIMTPVFLIFSLAMIYLSRRFSKGLRVIDLSFITALFVIFFPLFHYLSSFTIDPTNELFAGISVVNYSMPLYLAFGIAFVAIGGLMMYLISKTQGSRFASRLALPIIAIGLGFFPLVATIPEYFVLLAIIGVVAILIVSIQVRLSNNK